MVDYFSYHHNYQVFPTAWKKKDSIIKSKHCSCIGPKFVSQHPHDGSQLTPLAKDSTYSLISENIRNAHVTNNYWQNISTDKINKLLKINVYIIYNH